MTKVVSKTVAGLAALAAITGMALAASEFDGTWNVTDSGGKAFEITLAGDGSAKADRGGEGMTGSWKAEGSAAVITWNTGWTTKIEKSGSGYKKTAFKKGEAEKPANSSAAEKVK